MVQSKLKKKDVPELTLTVNIYKDRGEFSFSTDPTYGQIFAIKMIIDEVIDFNCPDLYTRAEAMLWVTEHIENIEEVPRK